MEVLRQSLKRAVRDIDLTFSNERCSFFICKSNFITQDHNHWNGFFCVQFRKLCRKILSLVQQPPVLIVDGQIIAANAGDSKAFLCSEGHGPDHNRADLHSITGVTLVLPAAAVVPATVAAVWYPNYTAAAGNNQATIAVHTCRFPCFNCGKTDHFTRDCRLIKEGNSPHALASMMNKKWATRGAQNHGLAMQLHHHVGDPHRRGSTCGYILPQWASYNHIVWPLLPAAEVRMTPTWAEAFRVIKMSGQRL
jgi:hypothetical protein